MARNEEKQLARLNRFYLEKQKQEELKKRPPRPRLDTLNTPRDLRKWLPTITRDIEFYVKQMEVTSYTDLKIEEFQGRIQRLRGEYRAFLQKLRMLEPDVTAASWADRPYSQRKRQSTTRRETEKGSTGDTDEPRAKNSQPGGSSRTSLPLGPVLSSSGVHLVPIHTPVLDHVTNDCVVSLVNPQPAMVSNLNPDTQDQPLHFNQDQPLHFNQDQSSQFNQDQPLHFNQDQPLQLKSDDTIKTGCSSAKHMNPSSSVPSSHMDSIGKTQRENTACNYAEASTGNVNKSVTMQAGQSQKTQHSRRSHHSDCSTRRQDKHNSSKQKQQREDRAMKPAQRPVVSSSDKFCDSSDKTSRVKEAMPVNVASVSEMDARSSMSCLQPPSSSNPLNLDYSDSSGEEV